MAGLACPRLCFSFISFLRSSTFLFPLLGGVCVCVVFYLLTRCPSRTAAVFKNYPIPSPTH